MATAEAEPIPAKFRAAPIVRPYTPIPEHGKAAAIAAHCHGVLSMESCARLFRAHPEWRNA